MAMTIKKTDQRPLGKSVEKKVVIKDELAVALMEAADLTGYDFSRLVMTVFWSAFTQDPENKKRLNTIITESGAAACWTNDSDNPMTNLLQWVEDLKDNKDAFVVDSNKKETKPSKKDTKAAEENSEKDDSSEEQIDIFDEVEDNKNKATDAIQALDDF